MRSITNHNLTIKSPTKYIKMKKRKNGNSGADNLQLNHPVPNTTDKTIKNQGSISRTSQSKLTESEVIIISYPIQSCSL